MLSCYEVLGPMGKGGMGEVYRARDTKLEREVALNVLPDSLVADEEHLLRFQREARLLASLNHPNVATIHGLDHVDGIHFLILELVPGVTLRNRLESGRLPVAEAMRVARQIAAGLEAAHATGIVHRDLKPANVILQPDGTAKILDFGLARRTEVSGEAEDGPLTKAFQVLGTPGYLSPEQARGEVADERADIWSFGCILYECLSGARAFPGRNVSESIRSVCERALDLEALPSETPPTARLLVSRCLARDSSSRLRAIGDVKLLLDDALDESSRITGRIAMPARAGGVSRRTLIVSLAAGMVGAGTLGYFLGGSRRTAAEPRTLVLPRGMKLGWRETSANLSKLGLGSPMLAISPDGRRVAYCAKTAEGSGIFVQDMGDLEPLVLEGTQDARAAFFHPDGDRVGFVVDDEIKVMSLDGTINGRFDLGSPAPNFSACYTLDGTEIIYATRAGLRRVSVGTKSRVLRSPDGNKGEVEFLDPSALPGEQVLFTIARGEKSSIAVLSLRDGSYSVLVDGDSARYTRGHLVYAQEGRILRAPYDPLTGEGPGRPELVRDRVFATPCAGGGATVTQFDVSTQEGTLVYAPATEPTASTAYRVDRNGDGKKIIAGAGDWKHARIVPGGREFTVDRLLDTGIKDVYRYSPESGLVPLTQDGMSINGAWHPDGYATVRSTHRGELRRLGTDVRGPFLEREGVLYADSWNAEGSTLIVTQRVSRTWSLWKWVGDSADLEPLPLGATDVNPRFGQISPDGQWLAYVADVPEGPEVFVRRFPEVLSQDRKKISQDGGGAPMWSKNELFYRGSDGSMYAVEYETGLELGEIHRQRLFAGDHDYDPSGHQHYDVTEDGQQFLMIENEFFPPDRIHVVADAIPGR